jgi:putative transcriptional regulator
MNLFRDLRESTRLLFLYEVTTSHHTRLRTIADRLGMTVQGASEYAHGLERDGLLGFSSGEYRATKKGVKVLHDRFHDLRSFVDRAGKEMAFVETTAALAGNAIHRGDRLGLFMEGGFLMAYAGRPSPSLGIAANDAPKGALVAVRELEGIVALHPGRIVVARVPSRSGGRRGSPAAVRRVLREAHDFVVAALDVGGLAAARELGLKPRIEFAVMPAAVEAAERGVSVLLLAPEERAAEAVQAIEAANARLEDKIPYESIALG